MAETVTTCYRHPDRRAGVSCQRCSRAICPSCMVQASVGFQCPDCVAQAQAQNRSFASPRGVPGVPAPRYGRAPGDGVARAPVRTNWFVGKPLVTLSLIALNVGVYLLDVASVGAAGLNSLLSSGGGELADQGFLAAQPVAFGEWWRIVTGGFLHAGLLHLGMNMLALWVLGSQLEPALGRLRFLALYITSLLAGSFAVLLFSPRAPTVGASGAIFGLLGVAFIFQRAQGINPWRSGIGALIVINVLFSFTIPGISISGHLGGLVGGGLAAWLVFEMDKRTRSTPLALAVCAACSTALFIGCLWAAAQWRAPLFGFTF